MLVSQYFVQDCSNHMFPKAIWDKLPESIFEKFEIAQVKGEQIQNF